ncbi:MAG: hypothetical protein HBSAPP03_00950 [Phycisphaerae bacterium]|nr:MAG: hypothetical protein HBSAPP03_00950 [Phycisphaerae bacterium]
MTTTILRRLALVLSCFAIAPAQAQEAAYVRAVDAHDGNSRQLQVAVRTFAPKDGAGPLVQMVGVVHIGDKAYYDQLQQYLDAQTIVLYEGVKPAGAGDTQGTDEDKAKITTARQRMLAILIARHRREHKQLPESIEACTAGLAGTLGRIAAAAVNDAWGRPMRYDVVTTAEGSKFEIESYGSDGVAGGEGHAADLRFSAQKPLTRREVSAAGEGIQTQLAEALGLVFQLSAIDYTRPSWKNSDLSVDEVEARLEAKGAGGEALFQMLDGSSAMAMMGGAVLKMIGSSPEMSFMAKMMLVEALPASDDMTKAAGAEMGALMEVIIVDRNAAVLADLKAALAEHPQAESIALFYGAGHLPDLERRLEADFGYAYKESRWFTAIDVDLTAIPGGKAQAEQMREMMKMMRPKP